MKERLKSVIGNGLPWGLTIFAFGYAIGYVGKLGTYNTLKVSAPFGLATLIVIGSLYRRLRKPVKDLENLHIQLDDHELLVLQAPANHLIDESLVPGKVALTNSRIIFKPFEVKEEIQPEYNWYLAQAEPLAFHKSIWTTGGNFLLKTVDGTSIMFEVDKLKPWKEALNTKTSQKN